MRLLKQSTAADILVFMVDSADHVSGKTGLTLTITLSKGAGAFNSISPTVTERASGWYAITLTSSHTDTLGDGALHITSTGADPTDTWFLVVPRHLADLAFPNTTGRGIDVDATGGVEITSGQAALANLDAAVSTRALEAGGNLATVLSRIIGTLAAGTHNPQSGDAYARIGATGSGLTSLAAAADMATVLARLIGTIAAGTHSPQSGDAYARIGAAGAALTAIGDTRLANLDATVSSRGTADPGDAMTLTALYDPAKTAAQAGDAMALTGPAVDAILDDVVEGALTFRQIVRLLLAFMAGKVTVVGMVRSFRDQADTKNRISGTEDDDGQRTGITVDGT